MEIMDSLKRLLQDVVVPELKSIKAENLEIKTTLQLTNKRLDDMNAHLVDQGRRIDETNKRIDELRVELRDEMGKMNVRIDRLYEVIVRRDEHTQLESRMTRLEEQVTELRMRIAA